MNIPNMFGTKLLKKKKSLSQQPLKEQKKDNEKL